MSRVPVRLLAVLVLLALLVPGPGRAEGTRPRRTPITLTVRDVEVRDVLLLLARAAKVSVLVSPQVKGKMATELHDIDPLEAMGLVARINGYRAAVVQKVVCVGPAADIENLRGGGEVAVIQLRSAKSSDVAALVSKLYKDLEIVEDPATNSLIVGPKR